MELFAPEIQTQPTPMLEDVIRLYSMTYAVPLAKASRMVRQDALKMVKMFELNPQEGFRHWKGTRGASH
jgi:hypothetical protein